MRKQKPSVEWQWEACDPDTGDAIKRGIVRTDRKRVIETAAEIAGCIAHIDDPTRERHLAPYWRGLEVHIRTRTISAWAIDDDVMIDLREALQSQDSATRQS